MELYSVLKPPTSSCSASTRSKGGRFNSAVAATMNMKNGSTKVRRIAQLGSHPPGPSPAWTSTMPLVDRVPVLSTTIAMMRPMAAS